MSVRTILEIGHPVLRTPAQPVTDVSEVRELIADLVDTMRAANGAGLAANQIGVPLRVCVIEVRPGNPRYPYKPLIPLTVLVNPVGEEVAAVGDGVSLGGGGAPLRLVEDSVIGGIPDSCRTGGEAYFITSGAG